MYPILDQKIDAECGAYALVWALMRMKNIDPLKVIEEMRPDFNKMVTIQQGANWLAKKGYIKKITPYRYNPLTIEKTPIVVRLFGVDWQSTMKPPYKLTMGWKSTFAHYVCVCGKWKIVNSWGEQFWDKGYFYFDDDQVKNFGMIHRINI